MPSLQDRKNGLHRVIFIQPQAARGVSDITTLRPEMAIIGYHAAVWLAW
jgi:hypothetical protein